MTAFILLGIIAVVVLILVVLGFRGSGDSNEATSPVPDSKGAAPPAPVIGADMPETAQKRLPVSQSGTRPLAELLPKQVVVLDLETTGLSPMHDEIIEIGMMRYEIGSSRADTFQLLVKPRKKIPRKITEITGITQQMIDDDAVELGDALTQALSFVGDLPIITYNASFDMAFLYRAAAQHGLTVSNRYTCALKRARRAWPSLDNHRLAYVADLTQADFSEAHRALGDCHRALLVFLAATAKLNRKVTWSKPGLA